MKKKKSPRRRTTTSSFWATPGTRIATRERVALRLFRKFARDAKMFSSSDRSPECIGEAIRYWTGYPAYAFMIRELCGDDTLLDDQTGRAFDSSTLESVHSRATQVLIELALQQGIDGGPISGSARLCRNLCHTHFETCTADGSKSNWPACIRNFQLDGLSEKDRDKARQGEDMLRCTLARRNLSVPKIIATPTVALLNAPNENLDGQGSGTAPQEPIDQDAGDNPPKGFPHGPLIGTKTEIGCAIHPRSALISQQRYRVYLQQQKQDGKIAIFEERGAKCVRVFFADETKFKNAQKALPNACERFRTVANVSERLRKRNSQKRKETR
jgi:hypothetical protein